MNKSKQEFKTIILEGTEYYLVPVQAPIEEKEEEPVLTGYLLPKEVEVVSIAPASYEKQPGDEDVVIVAQPKKFAYRERYKRQELTRSDLVAPTPNRTIKFQDFVDRDMQNIEREVRSKGSQDSVWWGAGTEVDF